jgi:hypothetical protein
MVTTLLDGLFTKLQLTTAALVSGAVVNGLQTVALREQAADRPRHEPQPIGDIGRAQALIGQFKEALAQRNSDGGRHGVTSWR